jgi:hypothetical protein
MLKASVIRAGVLDLGVHYAHSTHNTRGRYPGIKARKKMASLVWFSAVDLACKMQFQLASLTVAVNC